MVIVGLILAFWIASVFITKQKSGGGPVTIRDFFPISNSPISNTPPVNINGNGETLPTDNGNTNTPPKFRQISNFAVAGATVVDETPVAPIVAKTKVSKTVPATPPIPPVYAIRYVERATGHLFEQILGSWTEKKVTNTTIPSIYEAMFGNNGNSAFLRYLNSDNQTIESFSGSIPLPKVPAKTASTTVTTTNTATVANALPIGNDVAETPIPELLGTFFPENISSAVVSPDGSKVFYLSSFGDQTLGTSANLDGTKKSQFFTSSFSEWIPQWPTARIMTITTKASASVPGFVYTLDTQTGDMNKIIGGLKGLTTLTSSDGKNMLYSVSNGKDFSLYSYSLKTNTTTNLNIKTLPEKCVWSSDNITVYCGVPVSPDAGAYPDVWYQGLTSFNDQIWKINTATSEFNMIGDPNSDVNVSMDATKLILDKTESNLFIVNKKDSKLWSLALQ